MIKNLLDADENPPPGTKVTIEETIIQPAKSETNEAAVQAERLPETENILEVPTVNNANISETPVAETNFQPAAETFVDLTKPKNEAANSFEMDYQPESKAETIRKSGLAYAAGLTLFASIVFMLILGWFLDLLLGTSPWATLGGIVLGAIVGFYQFFRLTSQIINNKN